MIKKNELTLFRADTPTALQLPFADCGVKAGFPSPAQDYLTESLDLMKEIIRHPAATFFARVSGDSMKDIGINDGDILVVDKSLSPQNGDVAVCYVDGEFTVKKLKISKSVIWLMPSNDQYKPIRVTAENDFMIWGVVTYSLKKYRARRT